MHGSPVYIPFLSGNDAVKLLEIIHRSTSCTVEEDFSGLFPKIQELFPFDFAGTLLGRLDNGNSLVINHGVNISFPDEWLREYSAKDYFHLDVVTKETFRTCRPQHWSYLTPYAEIVPKDVMALNMDLGMKECYTHGVSNSSPGQNGSMFCFTGPSLRYDRRAIAILELVVPHLHLALSGLYDKKQPENRNVTLSCREKEVLNWLKEGKSSWDISTILGISESTANYHVYNIMRKLDVSNRPQAVAVAARLGLIEIG